MECKRYISKEEVELADGTIIPGGRIIVEKPEESDAWICEIIHNRPVDLSTIDSFAMRAETGEVVEVIKPKLRGILIDCSIDYIEE
ncbi:MAG: hypothetical protein QXJ75_04755 [Candidatus Bathyarchaeia archaeon]